jgi:hypothetical protein
VLHRDFKPSNILVDENDHPRITDFGLAKRARGDFGLTVTGQLLGSPNFMPPEQTSGKSGKVGPASDVYGLGAIVYHLLTGRPPFQAETIEDVLRQLHEADPVAPRLLNPSIPRDLETICLKCLAKDPRKRYASAEALADDLHRFLATEPIHARRVSWHERARKWARRRPALAALIAVVLLAVGLLTLGSIAYSVRVRGERDRAEHNFQLAMRAVDGMLTEVGDEQLAFEPRMEEKRKALLSKALELYQEFLKEKEHDPRVRLETAQRRSAGQLQIEQHRRRALLAEDPQPLSHGRSPERPVAARREHVEADLAERVVVVDHEDERAVCDTHRGGGCYHRVP